MKRLFVLPPCVLVMCLTASPLSAKSKVPDIAFDPPGLVENDAPGLVKNNPPGLVKNNPPGLVKNDSPGQVIFSGGSGGGTTVALPEPGTLAMVITGFVGVLLVSRRRPR